MELADVTKVGILGSGVMGTNIAAAVAPKYRVVVRRRRVDENEIKQSLKKIQACFPSLIKRNILTEAQTGEARSHLSVTADLGDLRDCQVIIDAVPDDLELKKSLFAELNRICPEDTIFTTTSSLLSITALAEGSGRPDRFIGTHFGNPAHLTPVVDIAPALQTSQNTVSLITSFLGQGLGKVVVKTKDSPGFILDYIFFPFLVRALKALEAGLGTAEDIDTVMTMGAGHRFGPFETMDMFGLDACVSGFNVLAEQLHDPTCIPPLILVKMTEAGYLGKKAGKGWYTYDAQGKKAKVTELPW